MNVPLLHQLCSSTTTGYLYQRVFRKPGRLRAMPTILNKEASEFNFVAFLSIIVLFVIHLLFLTKCWRKNNILWLWVLFRLFQCSTAETQAGWKEEITINWLQKWHSPLFHTMNWLTSDCWWRLRFCTCSVLYFCEMVHRFPVHKEAFLLSLHTGKRIIFWQINELCICVIYCAITAKIQFI